jgi:hypothetical protein
LVLPMPARVMVSMIVNPQRVAVVNVADATAVQFALGRMRSIRRSDSAVRHSS